MTKGDKFLIGFLLIAGLAGVLFHSNSYAGSGDKWVEISVNGELAHKIALKEGYRQEIRIGGSAEFDVIDIKDGSVRVREADCPDQDCIKTGWISRPGQQIVCLPYRLVISIHAEDDDGVDAISR